MEERVRFVHQWQGQEQSLAELCRQYGVSRKTGYKWLERYGTEGIDGLKDRSRAPVHRPNEVSEAIQAAVIGQRGKHPRWGPKKIRAVLERKDPGQRWPAESTIGEILKQAGLTTPPGRRAKVAAYRNELGTAEGPNQIWCADYKGWFYCGDGKRCDPLTLTDRYSRYVLKCQQVPSLEQEYARALFEAAFREYGMPEAIRNDNGSPFASTGLAGLSGLAVWWIQLGIRPERIRAGKPQQNGQHERMHRSLKEETANPPKANLRAQQRAFDAFQREYNEERPHEALNMLTPAEVYRPSPREYPKRLSKPEYDSKAVVRTVGNCGRIRWNGERVFISKALGDQPIRLEPVNDGLWKLWFSSYPLGLLDEEKMRVIDLDDKRASRSRSSESPKEE